MHTTFVKHFAQIIKLVFQNSQDK